MADKKKPAAHEGGGGASDTGLFVIVALVIIAVAMFGMSQPLFNTNFANPDYFFQKFLPVVRFFLSGHTWYVFGIISSTLSIFFIGVVIYCLVRMREIQLHEKREINHLINEALARDAETSRNENPRWLYILTLVESSNESDWRVAIMEADTMLDEVLQERGYEGDTLADRLKSLQSNAFASIQNAWDAHNLRNQIAHEGLEFPLSQVETRRTIKMYQNVFEELKTI